MSRVPSAQSLMKKSLQAQRSAQQLLETQDADGACNRAYYAMFDAARAALLAANIESQAYKTHSSLITTFGLHLIKTGTLPIELGRAINRAEEIRLIADYTGDFIEQEDARNVVEQALFFIEAIRTKFFSDL